MAWSLKWVSGKKRREVNAMKYWPDVPSLISLSRWNWSNGKSSEIFTFRTLNNDLCFVSCVLQIINIYVICVYICMYVCRSIRLKCPMLYCSILPSNSLVQSHLLREDDLWSTKYDNLPFLYIYARKKIHLFSYASISSRSQLWTAYLIV